MDAGEGATAPWPRAHEVRRAEAGEAAALARTLALAFESDPVMSWAIPGPARPAILERAFDLYLRRIWLRHQETYAVAGTSGVAAWEPPGTWKLGAGEQLALLPAMARIFGRRLPRTLGALARLEKDHPEEPHFYLPFMGVEPASQGRGIGSALLRPILERCDAEAVPAYLEASAPRNRALYERHGFEVSEEFRVGRDSPPLWRMWRGV
jgi:ribosomal protein S18 acetylase RimI-like enzyme